MYYEVLECLWCFQCVGAFPKVIDETAEHVDEVSNDFVFGSGFDLDVVKHAKCRFDAPSFAVLVDVEVLIFLSGVRGKDPVVAFTFVVSKIRFDEHESYLDVVFAFVF